MINPWDPHKHVASKVPDEDGDVLCEICGLVMEGPVIEESKEILKVMNKIYR